MVGTSVGMVGTVTDCVSCQASALSHLAFAYLIVYQEKLTTCMEFMEQFKKSMGLGERKAWTFFSDLERATLTEY